MFSHRSFGRLCIEIFAYIKSHMWKNRYIARKQSDGSEGQQQVSALMVSCAWRTNQQMNEWMNEWILEPDCSAQKIKNLIVISNQSIAIAKNRKALETVNLCCHFNFSILFLNCSSSLPLPLYSFLSHCLFIHFLLLLISLYLCKV